MEIYSKHCQSQTGRARELKFLENVHPTLCVMCHVSCAMCHVLCVMCHVSPVTCHMSPVQMFAGCWLPYLGFKSTYDIFRVYELCKVSQNRFWLPERNHLKLVLNLISQKKLCIQKIFSLQIINIQIC